MPSDLYSFDHKEVLKKKRAVIQTEKIKSLQQAGQVTKKRKNDTTTRNEKTPEKKKKENKQKQNEQKKNRKEKKVPKKLTQKKAASTTNQTVHEKLIEMSDLMSQFDDTSDKINSVVPNVEKATEEHKCTREPTTATDIEDITPAGLQSPETSLTSTWTLCTSNIGLPISPARTSTQNDPGNLNIFSNKILL